MSKQRLFNGQPPPASATIDGNDDLLKEILRRLPAKSLLRSSCVSKRWLSIISDPHFSLLWSKPKSNTIPGLFLRRLSHPTSNPILDYVLLNRFQYPLENVPFNPLDSGIKSVEENGIDVLQSCNGLLLCSSFRLRHHSCNFYVCNPTTNKYRSLPRPIGFGEKIVRGVNLAFDPSKSHHYKVICVCSHTSLLRGFYWVQIYSSETHTWRAYDDILVGPFDVAFENGVFWNGAINWLSRESETSLNFDVDSESSNILPMPPLMKGDKERGFGFFNVSSGNFLHIGLFSAGGSQSRLDVFTMEKDFSKWVLKYHVNLEATIMELHMPVPLPLVYWKFSVLGLLWDETEKESCLVIYVPGKVACYNIEEKCLTNVRDLNVSSHEDWSISPNCKWVAGYPYMESLSCV